MCIGDKIHKLLFELKNLFNHKYSIFYQAPMKSFVVLLFPHSPSRICQRPNSWFQKGVI